MAYSKSKTKGSSYELKIAKTLTKWWGFDFHRTPGSGSWSSTHSSDMQAGDIITPIEANFPFVVECKNQEQWSGDDIIFNRGKYPKFWQQVVGDALRVRKVPMLIAHRNRSKNYCTIPYSSDIMSILDEKGVPNAVTYISYTDDMLEETSTFKILTVELDEFMEVFTPEYLKEHIPTYYKEWAGNE